MVCTSACLLFHEFCLISIVIIRRDMPFILSLLPTTWVRVAEKYFKHFKVNKKSY